MHQKQLEDIFDFYGLSEVYRGKFEDVEHHWLFKDAEPTILEDFLILTIAKTLHAVLLRSFVFIHEFPINPCTNSPRVLLLKSDFAGKRNHFLLKA